MQSGDQTSLINRNSVALVLKASSSYLNVMQPRCCREQNHFMHRSYSLNSTRLNLKSYSNSVTHFMSDTSFIFACSRPFSRNASHHLSS
jgi:hypothetical protein